MKHFTVAATIMGMLTLGLAAAGAQDRPHYRRTAQVTVDSVDAAARILTVKRSEGYYVRLHVPDSISDFATLKPGDSVKATYNENVILTIGKAGAQAHARETVGAQPKTPEEAHGNPDITRITTATITAVDEKWGNITFSDVLNPGITYLARLDDKAMLKKVKVGDKMNLTFTQATLVSLVR